MESRNILPKGLQIEVALLISEKDIYRDQMIDTTIWRPLSDFLIETEVP